jgi:predicted ATPase
VRRSAYSEATAHFEQGLRLVSGIRETPERARLELSLLVGLGPVLFGTRGFAAPEVERCYARAKELCDQLGDTPEAFAALWGQWGILILQGDVRTALEIGEQLLALARSSSDSAPMLQARHALWPTHFYRGELVAAMEDFTEGLALYDVDRHRSLAFTFGGHDARVCGLAFQSPVLWLLGYPQQALECGRRALDVARSLAHPHSVANAHSWVSLAFRILGDFELARAEAEAGQAVSAEYGFPQWSAVATIIRGSTLAAVGHVEGGLTEMRSGLAAWQATGAGAMIPTFLAFIAEAEVARGDIAAALRIIDDALKRIDVYGERIFEAELHRLRGEAFLAGRTPDPVRAETCFLRAIDIAREQLARSFELRAVTSLARLWQRGGRAHDARRVLAATAGWFTEGHETRDYRGAHQLLEELADR